MKISILIRTTILALAFLLSNGARAGVLKCMSLSGSEAVTVLTNDLAPKDSTEVNVKVRAGSYGGEGEKILFRGPLQMTVEKTDSGCLYKYSDNIESPTFSVTLIPNDRTRVGDTYAMFDTIMLLPGGESFQEDDYCGIHLDQKVDFERLCESK